MLCNFFSLDRRAMDQRTTRSLFLVTIVLTNQFIHAIPLLHIYDVQKSILTDKRLSQSLALWSNLHKSVFKKKLAHLLEDNTPDIFDKRAAPTEDISLTLALDTLARQYHKAQQELERNSAIQWMMRNGKRMSGMATAPKADES